MLRRRLGEDEAALLRAAIDAIPALIGAKDRQSRYIFVNAHQARLYGTTPGAAIGRSAAELLGHEYGDRTRALDQRVIESGEAIRAYEETYADAAGRPHDWLTTKVPLRSRAGEVIGVATVSVDVTERNALARARWSAEARADATWADLRGAIESLPDAFVMYERDGRLITCNEPMRRQHPELGALLTPGARFEDLLRATAASGSVPEAEGREEEWIAERLAEFERPGPPRELQLADGRWVLIRMFVTATGARVRVRSDITERKRAELAMLRAKEAAEQASRAKSTFLANMSHELRTPLNAVIGFAEMIERGVLGAVGNPRYAGYAADIRASGEHLLSIINEILDLSKIEAGKHTLRETLCDVRRLVQEAVRVSTAQGRMDVAPVSVEAATALPPVQADERALLQMLINLLSNALKFTPAAGRVSVGARIADDGGLELEVVDTGIGIDRRDIDLALSPFGQVESALQRRHGGTGLGLPLVRSLAELHGGRLTIESRRGAGTRASIWLPPARVATAARALPPPRRVTAA
jgi:two-component system cell cycle sensor histidine kinase PleC